MRKREKHILGKDEIEIGPLHLRQMLMESWDQLDIFLESIFCTCGVESKKLVQYKPYLNNLNDVILRGKCSGCNTIATRYIETGERKGVELIAKRIRNRN
jgi:hypothetical protein